MIPVRTIGALLGVSLGCMAGIAGTSEYEIKGAYLYNFAKFVEWPPGDLRTALTICLYGKSAVEGFLEEAVRGKLVHDLPVKVQRISDGVDNWDACKLIFLGASNPVKVQQVLERLRGRGVLTIGESEAFAECGGMITLVIEGGRVRFDINLQAAADAHLKISSKLLELARTVR
jgi:hypothetical protein